MLGSTNGQLECSWVGILSKTGPELVSCGSAIDPAIRRRFVVSSFERPLLAQALLEVALSFAIRLGALKNSLQRLAETSCRRSKPTQDDALWIGGLSAGDGTSAYSPGQRSSS